MSINKCVISRRVSYDYCESSDACFRVNQESNISVPNGENILIEGRISQNDLNKELRLSMYFLLIVIIGIMLYWFFWYDDGRRYPIQYLGSFCIMGLVVFFGKTVDEKRPQHWIVTSAGIHFDNRPFVPFVDIRNARKFGKNISISRHKGYYSISLKASSKAVKLREIILENLSS